MFESPAALSVLKVDLIIAAGMRHCLEDEKAGGGRGHEVKVGSHGEGNCIRVKE